MVKKKSARKVLDSQKSRRPVLTTVLSDRVNINIGSGLKSSTRLWTLIKRDHVGWNKVMDKILPYERAAITRALSSVWKNSGRQTVADIRKCRGDYSRLIEHGIGIVTAAFLVECFARPKK